MTNLVDRKFGCYYPLPPKTVGGAWPYNFNYIEAIVGRNFDVYSTFLSLDSDYPGNSSPPSPRSQHSDIAAAAAAGHDILVAMNPVTSFAAASGGFYPVYATNADIVAGTWDTMMTGLFTWLLSLNVNITVRWNWESNLQSSAWFPGFAGIAVSGTKPPSNTVFTTTGLSVTTSAADYIAGFNHVSALGKALSGGSRFKMFYCPGAQDQTAGIAAGYTLATMYPGTSADVVGYDLYNSLGNVYHTPEDIMRGIRENDAVHPYAYDLFQSLAPSAPIWIGETNCVDLNDTSDTLHLANGQSKAAWYASLFAITDLPALACVNFFDAPGTRKTWPFNSSSDALTAFEAGFNFAITGTQHGVAASPYSSGTNPPFNPTSNVLPLPGTHLAGDSGLASYANFYEYVLNQLAGLDASGWVVAKSNSDGDTPALTVTANSVGSSSNGPTFLGAFLPAVQINTPGGSPKEAVGIKQAGNTFYTFRLRDDGRMEWGAGSADIDTELTRTAANTLSLTSNTGGAGNLIVAGQTTSGSLILPDVTAPTAPAASGGVLLYGNADGLMYRNSGTNFPLTPPQTAQFTQIVPYEPATANTASSALTNGVLYLVRLELFFQRAVTRIGMNIVVGGVGLTTNECLAGLYDSSGNLLVSTADQSTVWNGTLVKNMTVTSTACNAGVYYVGVLSNATTSGPTVSRSAGVGNLTVASGATTRFGKYGTAQIALPNPLTLASITLDTDNKLFWFS